MYYNVAVERIITVLLKQLCFFTCFIIILYSSFLSDAVRAVPAHPTGAVWTSWRITPSRRSGGLSGQRRWRRIIESLSSNPESQKIVRQKLKKCPKNVQQKLKRFPAKVPPKFPVTTRLSTTEQRRLQMASTVLVLRFHPSIGKSIKIKSGKLANQRVSIRPWRNRLWHERKTSERNLTFCKKKKFSALTEQTHISSHTHFRHALVESFFSSQHIIYIRNSFSFRLCTYFSITINPEHDVICLLISSFSCDVTGCNTICFSV